MNIEFEVSGLIPATPQEVFTAWLDSKEHSLMTASPSLVSAVVGETFEAGDGYIQGRNLELHPPHRILQSWRTTEFDSTDKDSRLEIMFTPADTATKVTIRHSDLPDDGLKYKQGWIDFYFVPMTAYFLEKSDRSSS